MKTKHQPCATQKAITFNEEFITSSKQHLEDLYKVSKTRPLTKLEEEWKEIMRDHLNSGSYWLKWEQYRMREVCGCMNYDSCPFI